MPLSTRLHTPVRNGKKEKGVSVFSPSIWSMGVCLVSALALPSASAACTTVNGGLDYTCSSTNTSAQVASNAGNVVVTTTPGFSISTVSADALSISGSGVTYLDANDSGLVSTSAIALNATVNTGGQGGLLIQTGGTLSGATDGIQVRNYGTGLTSLVLGGPVSGATRWGILAFNDMSTTALTVTALSDVSGAGGINVQSYGTGSTSLSITGEVRAPLSVGVFAFNNTLTDDLAISVGGAVSADTSGIWALNYGSGTTTLTAQRAVSGLDEDGISATNGPTTTSLTILSADVSGGQNGIWAQNDGTGSTTITATGRITGTTENGIYAVNGSTAMGLAITANDVRGGEDGVRAFNYGLGATNLAVSGAVAGGTGYGIHTFAPRGLSVISTGTVSAASGIAIFDEAGSVAHLINAGLLDGQVHLGDGNDALTQTATGQTTPGVTLDGGAGVDTLTLEVNDTTTDNAIHRTGWREIAPGQYIGFESVVQHVADESNSVQLLGRGTHSATLTSGIYTVNSGTLSLPDSDSWLQADTFVNEAALISGNGTIEGDLTINAGGTASPGNSPGMLSILGNFNLASDATYRVEILATQNPVAGLDNDLITTQGAATFYNDSHIQIVPLSTDAQFAALDYTTPIRYTILSAAGGITREGVLLSNSPEPTYQLIYEDAAGESGGPHENAILKLLSNPPDWPDDPNTPDGPDEPELPPPMVLVFGAPAGLQDINRSLLPLPESPQSCQFIADSHQAKSNDGCTWLRGTGRFGHFAADATANNSHRVRFNSSGVEIGFEHALGESPGGAGYQPAFEGRPRVGAALRYGQLDLESSTFGVDDAIDQYEFWLTARQERLDGWNLDAHLGWRNWQGEFERDTGLHDTPTAQFDFRIDGLQAGAQVGYRIPLLHDAQLIPQLAYTHGSTERKSFSEQGAGAANFHAETFRMSTDHVTVALAYQQQWQGEDTNSAGTLLIRAGAVRALGDLDAELNGSYQGAPRTVFHSTQQAMPETIGLFDLALRTPIHTPLVDRIDISLQTRFGSGYSEQRIGLQFEKLF